MINTDSADDFVVVVVVVVVFVFVMIFVIAVLVVVDVVLLMLSLLKMSHMFTVISSRNLHAYDGPAGMNPKT